MATQIFIPTPLQRYADNKDVLEITGKTVGNILFNLTAQYPDLKKHLYNEQGRLRSFVNVFLNDEDIRFLKGLDTKVESGDSITIVPSVAGGDLSNQEILRYSRHLIMPEVGMAGQNRLKRASVLLVGVGGLGSPLGMYLAAAGCGRIGLVDFDTVEFQNLHRQIIYSTDDVGKPKLDVAKTMLTKINPDIKIEIYPMRLTSENALGIFRDYEIIVDGSDNFPTRYLVNDACVILKKVNVYGSIFRFEGQATVFDATKGPCYRCLYPQPPPPGLVPSCAEGGVLGILPGIIGLIQATETIKLIIGNGEPLIGRLLLFNALKMSFKQLKLKKDPTCPICGETPTITQLIDYNEFCGITQHKESEEEIIKKDDLGISPEELSRVLKSDKDASLIDVREPNEYQICHIKSARFIPLSELQGRVNELDTADETILYCHHGIRSKKAVEFLQSLGFKKTRHLIGGIDEWAKRIDSTMPRY